MAIEGFWDPGPPRPLTGAESVDLPGLILAGRWKSPAMPAHYTQHLAAQNTPAAQYLETRDRLADEASELKPLSELFSELAAMTARLQCRLSA